MGGRVMASAFKDVFLPPKSNQGNTSLTAAGAHIPSLIYNFFINVLTGFSIINIMKKVSKYVLAKRISKTILQIQNDGITEGVWKGGQQ
ncbi:hypothetical protein [Paenibacillus eucommiae]|uniref:Prolipoprotein diacylglyceryltransferase n=1 Tax=Paenibacillus eucommiae TaxID=1355755 RepID=A0ABS4J728_9BACL|nr:hypothetical protein [Paenibacillus eucommiae]MBP1995627.1 prolipoprotein diacylglyceryltransferase [Paenibacillus eucommiae]